MDKSSKESIVVRDIKTYVDYKMILDSFIDLMYKLNIRNSIDIYAAFTYMLYKGYLSYDNNFKLQNSNGIDVYTRFNTCGPYLMTGSGSCRNIAEMLHDIYDETGFLNTLLPVVANNYKIQYEITSVPIDETYQEKINLINKYVFDSNYKKYLLDLIKQHGSNIRIYKTSKVDEKNSNIKEILTHILGNHEINAVVDSLGKTKYILDGTSNKVFNTSDINSNYLISDNGLYYKISKPSLILTKKYDNTSFVMGHDEYPRKYMYKIIESTRSKCAKNEDKLKEFSDKNRNLYKEIKNNYIESEKIRGLK